VHKCDLCNEVRDCVPKVIGDKEYDVCVECWKALKKKLKGKGKEIRIVEPLVLLPDPRELRQREDDEPEQFPGEPPVIWAGNGLTP
jgi:hypothetical protein